jgi:hypothetical protein
MEFNLKGNRVNFVVFVAALLVVAILVCNFPSGLYSSGVATPAGQELLVNPDFTNNYVGWRQTHWRSAGDEPTSTQWKSYSSAAQMSVSGYDLSYYAVGLEQGDGPLPLWSYPTYQGLNVTVKEGTVISWTGSMDRETVSPVGCLGMGLNLWFNVYLQNGSVLPLELFLFFYQDGTYALPVGSYRDYGYRGSSELEKLFDGAVDSYPTVWRYFYFHVDQLKQGITKTEIFDLNDYVNVVREKAGDPYNSAVFELCRVVACMEVFNGEGCFTVNNLSLKQQ